MPNYARWIAIGDLHDNIQGIENIPALSTADGIIITGDLTKIGGLAEARKIIETIQKYNNNILAQFGNLDRIEVNEYLDIAGINLHCQVKEINSNTAIIGVGGSIFSPFGTPSEFPESKYGEWLEQLYHKARHYKNIVVVSHNPPYNTKCDQVTSGVHVGSKALREFIEETQPNICLCGHIHEAKSIDILGKTIIANPGAFVSGTYVNLQINENKFELSLEQIL